LPEPVEAQEAGTKGVAKRGDGYALMEQQHAADDHEIARPIHPQPGDIDARHALAFLFGHGEKRFAGNSRNALK
jgi:hypothetical protein